MRTNLPVTNNEVQLTDATLIVSKTDLKGRMTYINKDFLDISGFTEAELIGEPHNLVRHPDMPVEAFQDLWDTLKAGRPWTGYVKNRCKNGDYYWVLANAAPIVENGQVTGYISVRRKASKEAIEAHEAVYRQFREKRQGRLAIRFGKPGVGVRKIATVPRGTFPAVCPRVAVWPDLTFPEVQRQIVRSHVDEAHQMLCV